MKNKRSEDYQVIEEVFDKSTLMVIYDFMNKQVIDEIHGVVNAGKEARVYWGKDPDGKELAIKIYLTSSAEFKKGMLPYIEGDPRFAHVRRDTRSLIYTWAQKEFKNLQRAKEAGVNVPEALAVQKNVLIMEFIGKDGERAPLMKETELEDAEKVFKRLLTSVKRLYGKAGLVHADLSEYNIMIWKGKPVIFDVAQSVLVKHPMADRFLRRDLENLHRYFKRQVPDIVSVDEMYEKVISDGRK
jgi:RIO kinase 1